MCPYDIMTNGDTFIENLWLHIPAWHSDVIKVTQLMQGWENVHTYTATDGSKYVDNTDYNLLDPSSFLDQSLLAKFWSAF